MSSSRVVSASRSPGKISPQKTGSAAKLWVPERGEFFLGNDLKQSLENGSLADVSLTVRSGISSNKFGEILTFEVHLQPVDFIDKSGDAWCTNAAAQGCSNQLRLPLSNDQTPMLFMIVGFKFSAQYRRSV